MKIPYQILSHYSLQKSIIQIDDLVAKAKELKLAALPLTDINSLSGCPELIQLLEKHNKKAEQKIKPVLGLTIFIHFEGKPNEVILYAKNKNGWKNLIKIVSFVRGKENYLFQQEYPNEALDTNIEYLYLSQFIHLDTKDLICVTTTHHAPLQGIFREDYYTNINGNTVQYLEPNDKVYLQIMVCSEIKKTIREQNEIITEYPEYIKYFDESRFDLEQPNFEFPKGIVDKIEIFSIEDKPKIPSFTNEDADEYLKQLCRNGWKERQLGSKTEKDLELRKVYTDRVQEELGVMKLAGIANYMLLVRDFIIRCKEEKLSTGLRGSAVGCLVSYLIGVSDIDPVCPDPALPYDSNKSLVFSRFINKGRFSEGRTSYPDCDLDVPPEFREPLKLWIRTKYGEDKVANIVTFAKLKGAATIKEVFRVLGKSYDLADEITKNMVNEARVQDELEDLKEDNPKYNIINYCIDHIPIIDQFAKTFPNEFEIAIKLTNIIKNEAQHAAGIVLADNCLTDFIPTKYDPDKDQCVVTFKMQDVEYVGGVKFDILGVEAYNKIDKTMELINANL